VGVARGENAIDCRRARISPDGDEQFRNGVPEPALEEISKADHHQRRADPLARTVTHRGLDMLYRLIKRRVTEMMPRIKIALPTAYPYQAGLATLAGSVAKLPP
jgi:hypothetical protein